MRWIAFAALGLIAIPASAHHSFAAQYDASKVITLHGVVSDFEWTNPHAMLELSVKGDDGKAVLWQFELGSPNGLMRAGWTKHTLKAGDEISVTAFAAKDGTRLGNAFRITLSNGKALLSDGASPAQYPTTR